MTHDIVCVLYGSHLYGTATENSDRDIKHVYIPDAEQIASGQIVRHTRCGRDKERGEKNTAADVDSEGFSLDYYLKLLADGQTLAVDMLFAPDWAMLSPPHPVWRTLLENRSRLVSRKSAKFVKYCQDQAKKYGIKGSRIHDLREILAWFDGQIAQHGPKARLFEAADSLPEYIRSHSLAHTSIQEVTQVNRSLLPHLACCDKQASYTVRLDAARAIFQRQLDRYGERALMAETNQGVDFKALSHAVRIGREALEFLNTGWISFPRPEADYLRAVKRGDFPYKHIEREIVDLVEQVEAASLSSLLPAEADQAYIDNLIKQVYANSA